VGCASPVRLRSAEEAGSDERPTTMWRVLPRSKRDWSRAALFLFQSFPLIAFLVVRYFQSIWPGHTRWTMDDLKLFVIFGDFVCVTVLVCVGFGQLVAGRRRSGCLNLGLAASGVCVCLPLLSFVRT
jgi:hypothetical protein